MQIEILMIKSLPHQSDESLSDTLRSWWLHINRLYHIENVKIHFMLDI